MAEDFVKVEGELRESASAGFASLVSACVGPPLEELLPEPALVSELVLTLTITLILTLTRTRTRSCERASTNPNHNPNPDPNPNPNPLM